MIDTEQHRRDVDSAIGVALTQLPASLSRGLDPAVSAASDVSKLQVYAAILIGDAMGRNPSLKEVLSDPRSKPKL
jgi:hypothetical protein